MSLLIADAGHKVTGVDLSKQRVNDLNLGITPLEEKGLDELHRRIKQKTLHSSPRIKLVVKSIWYQYRQTRKMRDVILVMS